MKIIVRNSDNIAFFSGESLSLDSSGASGIGWTTNFLNSSNSRIETVETLPEGFIAGGWTYENEVFSTNSIGDAHLENINNSKIPQRVTMRQARLALLDAGILTTVETFIATQSESVKIYWATSTHVKRDHPIVASVQSTLNLTETQLDNLFIAAGQHEE